MIFSLNPIFLIHIPIYSLISIRNLPNYKCNDVLKRLDVIQKAKQCGFDAEAHHFMTRDLYKLTVHRILPSFINRDSKKKPPILLLHGLLADANFYMINDCSKCLPLILSSLGYDVFLGNVRGTKYSYIDQQSQDKHSRFWDFSFQEIAKYDIPDMIKYVLSVTSAPKLTYIGHSQGCLVLFAAISDDPSLNNLIDKFIAFGPATRIANIRGIGKYIEKIIPFSQRCPENEDMCEFLPHFFHNTRFVEYICRFLPFYFCALPLFHIVGINPHDLEKDLLMSVIRDIPSPTSTKNIAHYAQMMKSKRFSKYDYGPARNFEIYGSCHSPSYDISKFSQPVYIFSGVNDYLTPPCDIKWLADQLSNVTLITKNDMAHLDYVIGTKSSVWVFKKVVEIFENDFPIVNE